MRAIFKNLCPNCFGEIDDDRLSIGAPCSSCLPLNYEELKNKFESLNRNEYVRFIYDNLKTNGTLKHYENIYRLVIEEENFEKLYKNLLDSGLWSPQRSWLKRYILGYSFSIVAPTGVGKTTFLLILSLEEAKRGKKVYLIFPTSVLLYQAWKRITEFKEKLGYDVKIVTYHRFQTKKEKEQALEDIKSSNFDILITTSQFLSKHLDDIRTTSFDLICVDDVDALLKASKNIDRVLVLLGFNEEIIKKALEYTKIFVKYNKSEEDKKRLEELEKEIEDYKNSHKIGRMIVSSATGRQRGLKSKIFRVLLGFEAGSSKGELRNIVDAYKVSEDYFNDALQIIKSLGDGGIIFFRQGIEDQELESFKEFLDKNGIRSEVVISKKSSVHKIIEKFRSEELDLIIAKASFYGSIVRGLDLPERVKYVLFIETPRFIVSSSLDNINPYKLLMIANIISDKLDASDLRTQINLSKNKLKRWLSPEINSMIMSYESEDGNIKELTGFVERVYQEYKHLQELVKKALSLEEVIKKIQEDPYLCFEYDEQGFKIHIPDIKTYIQASGRCSRMYVGGITKGLSVIIDRDEKIVKSLERMLKIKFEGTEIVPIETLDLKTLKNEIDQERKRVKEFLSGNFKEVQMPDIKTTLFVVESPNKARTIANFFGKPSRINIDNLNIYEVTTGNRVLLITASIGHIYDLVTREGIYGVKIVKNRFVPVYTTIKTDIETGETFTDHDIEHRDYIDKINIVRALQTIASVVDEVIIGTDFDTEGEKIAWDIYLTLKSYTDKIKRAVFTEVTRKAILNAIDNLRDIDLRWVEAQIVRRIEDRWIGFSLSQKLWEEFEMTWLSAGRVQTPVLGEVIKRYEEYKKELGYFFDIVLSNGLSFQSRNIRVKTLKEAKKIREELLGTKATLVSVEKEEREYKAPPPYTTDTMLEDAVKMLKLSTDKVMSIAQNLFELGLCVTGDTKVIMADGSIKEIMTLSEIERVIGLNGIKYQDAEIKKFWKKMNDEQLYVIELVNGYKIAGTPDHGILVVNRNNEFEWVSLKNIIPDDYVVFIYGVPIKRKSISEFLKTYKLKNSYFIKKILYLVGLLSKKDYKIINDRFVEVKFGENLEKIIKELALYLDIEISEKDGIALIESEALAILLKNFDKDKINGQIFSLEEEYLNYYIAGYLEDKIIIEKNNNKIIIAIQDSRENLEYLGIYLYSIGIGNDLRDTEDGSFLVVWSKDVYKFINKICVKMILNGHKIRHLIAEKDIEKTISFDNDFKLISIKISKIQRQKSIEPQVYDITTSTSNFIANGIISHNCTYHRTDSTHVSSTGISIAKDYIVNKFSEDDFVPRKWSSEGAHECIRPTRPLDSESLIRMINEGVLELPIRLTPNHIKLYDLIFRRFIASQMKNAKVEYSRFKIRLPFGEEVIEGITDIKEYGYLKVYGIINKITPPTSKDYSVKYVSYWKGSTVPLYTQGDLIRLMKEKEIGRPSTYAKIVTTLLKRKYVIESRRSRFLIPTKLGIEVYRYLITNFKHIVSEERTRELEKKMLKIENGEVFYQEVLKETYEEIKEIIKELNMKYKFGNNQNTQNSQTD